MTDSWIGADSGTLAPDELGCDRLLEAVGGLIFTVDTERRIRWMNRKPRGPGSEHLVGRDVTEAIAEPHRLVVGDAVDGVVNGGPPVTIETQLAFGARWHRLRLLGLDERGVVVGVVVHATDIDDQKTADATVAFRRGHCRTWGEMGAHEHHEDPTNVWRRFELMADALPVLISYVDAKRRYQYNNAAYEKWFRTTRDALRGRSLDAVLGTAAYQRIQPYVDAALSGRPVTFALKIPYQDAGLRDVIARYVPCLTDSGDVTGFYALVEDVSARSEAERVLRRREEELRQLQRMEALGRLAGGIAHDFNNLLGTIVTGLHVAMQDIEEASVAAQTIDRVQRAARQGVSLTRQLLNFSRKDELRAHPIDFDEVIRDTAFLLGRLLGADVEVDLDLRASAQIVADAGQIQQVLMNLAINARDAMPQGGCLRMTSELATWTVEEAAGHVGREPGRYVMLSVSDTGTGMDGETQARVFEPFFTTKDPDRGTGLGLSTVFGIVRQIGGHIELESEPGSGTTFRIYFPAPEGNPAGSVPPETQQ